MLLLLLLLRIGHIANSLFQSCGGCTSCQPKPFASANSSLKAAPYTSSFLGTQPRMTHVPPAPATAQQTGVRVCPQAAASSLYELQINVLSAEFCPQQIDDSAL
jgi:hypothetical protein